MRKKILGDLKIKLLKKQCEFFFTQGFLNASGIALGKGQRDDFEAVWKKLMEQKKLIV